VEAKIESLFSDMKKPDTKTIDVLFGNFDRNRKFYQFNMENDLPFTTSEITCIHVKNDLQNIFE
jgi:hypothetical protein